MSSPTTDLQPISQANEPAAAPIVTPPPGLSLTLSRALAFLLRYWWVPVLTLVLSLAAGILYAHMKPPTYLSYARMWETVKLRLPEGSLFSEGDIQNFIGTQTELLQSKRLAEMARNVLRTSTNTVPMGKDGEPLKVYIRLIQAAKSTVFTLEATSSDQTYTQAFLDALMKAYLQYKADVRAQVTGYTAESINKQVEMLETARNSAQKALADFQQSNNLPLLQEQSEISGNYLARLNTQLSDYQLELQLTTNLLLSLERDRSLSNVPPKLETTEASRGASPGASSPSLDQQTAIKEIALLKLQREKLSQWMRPKHPKIVKLDADIERLQKVAEIYFHQNYAQSSNQLVSSRQNLEMKIDNLVTTIRTWESNVTAAHNVMAQAERLKVNVAREQSQYERMLTLLKNIDISRKIEQETLAILEPATPALRSYKEMQRLIVMSGLGGLALGLGLVLLLAIRDDRLITLNEVSHALVENILGQVPEVVRAKREAGVPLLESNDERHMYAESYRNLRSALLYLPVQGQRPKILLITSAMPGEGKSTVAVNLARALAFGGAKVLLVDGDLRKGILHKMLGMQREPGLADLLSGSTEMGALLQTNSLPNFTFLGSGKSPSQSGELFLRPSLPELFNQLRQQFDYVLIDSSPVFASDDVTTLAPKTDGTIFVVRRGYSHVRPVREALDLLYQRQAMILGLVFTRANASARSFYYYKYGGYHPKPEATNVTGPVHS